MSSTSSSPSLLFSSFSSSICTYRGYAIHRQMQLRSLGCTPSNKCKNRIAECIYHSILLKHFVSTNELRTLRMFDAQHPPFPDFWKDSWFSRPRSLQLPETLGNLTTTAHYVNRLWGTLEPYFLHVELAMSTLWRTSIFSQRDSADTTMQIGRFATPRVQVQEI